MPTYTFKNKDTGEVFDKIMKIADKPDYLRNNPNIAENTTIILDEAHNFKHFANDINIKFANKNPIFIGVLNGSFIFLSDLLRRLEIDCEVDFIKVACLNFTNIGTYYFWFFEFSMKYSA